MKILETGLYTKDLEASEKFFVEVLGLRVVAKKEGRHVFFKYGDSAIVMFDPSQTDVEGGFVPRHGAQGPGHMAFGVTSEELQEWKDRLIKHKVQIEKELEWEDGSKSIYFRDPGDNLLEFIEQKYWEQY